MISTAPNTVKTIIETIKKMPGEKVLTLMLANANPPEPVVINFFKNEQIDYEDGQGPRLFAILNEALRVGGTLLIKQVLPLEMKVTNGDGETDWLPQKKLYLLTLGKGGYLPMSSDELRQSYCTDQVTGETFTPEPGLLFSTFPG